MIKQILTTVVAIAICATTFAQNTPFNSSQRTTQSLRKTVLTVDKSGNVSGNIELGEKCLQDVYTKALMEYDPIYRQGVESAKLITYQIARELESGQRAAPPVYTIPIVFHVIHKGESVGTGTNISSAQIQSSVDALNRDYRRTSANGGVAQGNGPDTEIQFCLAGVDPNGNPHSGINRVNGTSVAGYAANGINACQSGCNDVAIKALSNWDNRYYLNIWVVSEINGNGADVANPNVNNNFTGGTMGYAYTPVSPITAISNIDGVVAVNLAVGNDPTVTFGTNGTLGYRLWWASRLNRTITHEVGHYLSLLHTFGNSCSESNCNTQGDQICDTPPTTQNNGCSSPCPGAQVENYMDYTDDDCQDQFTAGQTTNMRAVLTGVRSALVATNNCGSSTSNDYDAGISAVLYPSGSICESTFDPVVTLTNYGAATLTSVQIKYYVDAQTPSTYTWNGGSLATGASVNVTLPSVTTTTGAHTFNANTTLPNNQADEDNTNNASSSSFNAGSADSYVTLLIYPDNYGAETTWTLTQNGGGTVATGGPYTNSNTALIEVEICVQSGECYTFEIEDSATPADGICCNYGLGTYSIADEDGILIRSGGEFGASETTNFCVPTLAAGCAVEYEPFESSYSGLALYTVTQGYVAGTNTFSDAAKAQAYPAPTQPSDISGMIVWVGGKVDAGGSVTANLYAFDGTGTNNADATVSGPGTVLASTSKPLAQIDTIGFLTRFDFANPVQVSSAYAVGLDVSGLYAGSNELGILTSVQGDAGTAERSWEKYNNGAWFTMDNYWDLQADFAIFPIICQSGTVGIDQQYGAELHLFPNPNNGNFAVVNPNMVDGQINIYNSVGQLIHSQSTNGESILNLNIADKSAGVYFVKLDAPQTNWVQRIVVQ